MELSAGHEDDLASLEAALREVLALDDLFAILDRLGITLHDYLGLPPPSAAADPAPEKPPLPPWLRVIPGGQR